MQKHARGTRRLLIFCLTVATTMVGGCGSIPDLKAFADATNDIRSSVVAVGNEFSASIPENLDTCAGEAGKKTSCREKFDATWKGRVEAVGAIADYSDSLAQVAAAGRDGAATAEKVLSSANGLLGALSVATIPTAIATAATKGLAELAKYRALSSMAEAIEAAQQPIKQVFDALDLDLATLDRTTSQEITPGLLALAEREDESQAGASIGQANFATASLRSAISTDYHNLQVVVKNLAALRTNGKLPFESGCRTEAACAQELQTIDKRIGENRTHLTSLERDLENLGKAYAPTQARKDAVTARAGQIRKAIVQLRSGLRDWLIIHRSLGADVRRGLQPNIRQLIATAADLKKLVDDMRKMP